MPTSPIADRTARIFILLPIILVVLAINAQNG